MVNLSVDSRHYHVSKVRSLNLVYRMHLAQIVTHLDGGLSPPRAENVSG